MQSCTFTLPCTTSVPLKICNYYPLTPDDELRGRISHYRTKLEHGIMVVDSHEVQAELDRRDHHRDWVAQRLLERICAKRFDTVAKPLLLRAGLPDDLICAIIRTMALSGR
jgi:hypothetical protein